MWLLIIMSSLSVPGIRDRVYVLINGVSGLFGVNVLINNVICVVFLILKV